MPELPEVETIKNDLLCQIVGRRFTGVRLFWDKIVRHPLPDEFRHRLAGQNIRDIRRRGKYLLFHLSNGEVLILHLKMSGFLLLQPSSEEPNPYTRAIFYLDNDAELRFCDRRKFGTIWLVKDESEIIGKLGPEPLDHSFNTEVLGRMLRQHSMPVKALLCDQNIIAGIGNMYADEALFAAQIHPLRKAKDLSREEVKRLYKAIRQVLHSGIEQSGASVDTYQRPNGELGTAHFLFKVAHRKNKLCYNCRTPLERTVVRGRGTYFCPKCQSGK
jgi:formamidopyrimidine-DNA glycosylase